MARSLLRTLLWLLAFAALVVAGYRIAADQRERFTAEELVPEGGRFVATAHGRLHVLEAGPADGVPVLLIHGSVGWSGLWSDTMRHLADEGYRVLALDLPPMGLSDRSNFTDYSRQAQGLRVLALVEAEGLQPIVVAHSFGAGAAMEAVLADPGAFRGAVIVAGALTLGGDGTGREVPAPLRSEVLREIVVANTVTNPHLTRVLFSRFVHRAEAITDAQVESVQYPFARQGTTDTIARWLPTLLVPPRGAASTDPAAYGGLSLPVALIWGREDSVTPPDQAVALQAALGGAEIRWLDDVGHIPQIEDPEVFHRALSDELDEITNDN